MFYLYMYKTQYIFDVIRWCSCCKVGVSIFVECHFVGLYRLDFHFVGILHWGLGTWLCSSCLHAPATKNPLLEIGLVMSVWKGIKDPKIVATDCHVNSCMAFRAVTLQMEDEDRMSVSMLEKAWKSLQSKQYKVLSFWDENFYGHWYCRDLFWFQTCVYLCGKVVSSYSKDIKGYKRI